MMPECKRCGEELVRDTCPCCEPGLSYYLMLVEKDELRKRVLALDTKKLVRKLRWVTKPTKS